MRDGDGEEDVFLKEIRIEDDRFWFTYMYSFPIYHKKSVVHYRKG